MKLKDIADMKEYLEERCYCPYEIYDLSGIFFEWFKPDTECKYIIGGVRNNIHGDFVIAQSSDTSNPQIIYIEHTDNKVDSCVRFDATEHNIKEVIDYISGQKDFFSFDEFEPGNINKSLSEVFKIADMVMI